MCSDQSNEQQCANTDNIQTFIAAFNKKVNILVIDDDIQICKMLVTDIFLSPLLNLIYENTFKGAVRRISEKKEHWHCWILDINLKETNDGSSLLDRFPDFDYAVIFSGVSTLETASNAIKKGAISAFSKDPAFLYSSDAFYNEVCKVAALSFIFKGAHNEHHEIFQPLFSNVLTSVEEWAMQVNISQRQLQRICELYVPFAPRMLLPLYHSLYYLIRRPSVTGGFESPTTEDLRIKNNDNFYHSCIDSVVNKLDTVYKPLLNV